MCKDMVLKVPEVQDGKRSWGPKFIYINSGQFPYLPFAFPFPLVMSQSIQVLNSRQGVESGKNQGRPKGGPDLR